MPPSSESKPVLVPLWRHELKLLLVALSLLRKQRNVQGEDIQVGLVQLKVAEALQKLEPETEWIRPVRVCCPTAPYQHANGCPNFGTMNYETRDTSRES